MAGDEVAGEAGVAESGEGADVLGGGSDDQGGGVCAVDPTTDLEAKAGGGFGDLLGGGILEGDEPEWALASISGSGIKWRVGVRDGVCVCGGGGW